MLFDLRGRGRQNTVKIVYITLAFLMGGGLIFFGIGGATNGGLFDAFTGKGSGGDTGAKRFENQVKDAQAKLARNRNDEVAWVTLIRAQVNLAGTGDQYDSATGQYTAGGKADLRKAIASWKSYVAIEPKDKEEEASVASRVAQAYGAVGDAQGVVDALEIVAKQRNTSGTWAKYAAAAYAAGNIRIGDLASKEAIKREDPDQRNQLKGELDSYKQQAAQSAVASVTPAPSAAAPSPAAKKKPGGKKKK
jgi:hypothetical protein